MALPIAVSRTAACSGCRQWVLRSFIASIGGLQIAPPVHAYYAKRHFSAQAPRCNTPRGRIPQEEEFALNEISDDLAEAQIKVRQEAKHAMREQEQSKVEEDETEATVRKPMSGNEVEAAMERLDIADTWEEVVSLWIEGRTEQAEQLLSLLKEEIKPKRKKPISSDVKLVLRALRGEVSEAIQRFEELTEDETVAESAMYSGASAAAKDEMANGEVVSEHQATSETDESTEPTDESPWYLQPQHQPQRQENLSPRAARQQVPELPPHPPPMLPRLLHYVSMDLGMDDLSLLDLRNLDPPPALGSNLLMLIGTARSEKHLHVSADRFCRWLRTEHRLSPFADGLLGRNELKLKMKRKAKRSRLLSAIGAKNTADTELDDGIRTGWVCVNIGRVEGGDLPDTANRDQQPEGFVGFGAPSGGSKIVVQLMTDEKRGEIDLERLWTGILNRSQREREKAATIAEEPLGLEEPHLDLQDESRLQAA